MNQYGAKWEIQTETGSETILRPERSEISQRTLPIIPILRNYVKSKDSDVSLVKVFSFMPENPTTYGKDRRYSAGSFEHRFSQDISQKVVLAELIATGLYDETNALWLGYLSEDGHFYDSISENIINLSDFWKKNKLY